ncbi:protein phosphatase regulator [Marasmius sp. AFHP31]|nr:protein phosphatase regulator [Marasmius sp. AFHP31]
MAHYLPVLMHSVTANVSVVPDDSSLETQATGQVDYLSHEWREEDVWRSWRNMTRQKNEIANGMRLENASWRTWWKQRNKLKTVNPESLNWLKDSDVTWLYGPLHTAVEWTPPPRPTRDETERKPASAQDRLDLSMPKYKSILKYRSISELLTSELPNSPVFSPSESETEAEAAAVSDSQASSSSKSRRLSLVHTKSDTHIARWGPDRTFRKDSPPRVEPPASTGASSKADSNTAENPAPARVSSSTNLTGYFNPHLPGQQSNNASSSSNSNSASASPRGTASELSNNYPQKKRHITFNTFVEQCIAIDKPKSPGSATGKGMGDHYDTDEDPGPGDDDGYDEDVEGGDEFDADWGLNECAITDSDSEYEEEIFIQDEDDDDDEDEEEPTHGDGVIEMRTSRQTKDSTKPALRSKSKASTSSSSSADSCASSSTSGSTKKRRSSVSTLPRRRRSGTGADPLLRRTSNSTARPSFSHSLSRHSSTSSERHGQQHASQMVTIAPIAPTRLKTGSSNYAHPTHHPAWDGFGVHPDSGSGLGDWMDGFGDEALSDDGGGFGAPLGRSSGLNGWRSSESDPEENLGTPVELVYVPPPSGRYGSSYGGRSSHSSQSGGFRINSSVNGEDAEVEQMEEAGEARRLGRSDDAEVQVKQTHSSSQPQPTAENGEAQPDAASTTSSSDALREPGNQSKRKPTSSLGSFGPSLPIVVRTPPAVERPRGSEDETEEDAYDYFGGPDLGGDYSTRRNPNRRNNKAPEVGRSGSSSSLNEERKSRSRSRTPSPQSATPAIAVPGQRPSSPGSSSALLSPPLRGRGAHGSGFGESSSRGRSSTRTSSSSLSDRERPRSRSNHSSPIGSLSPDGSAIGLNYGVYATGRIGDRGDRERERPAQRTGGRGRERTERRLSHSLSPDVEGVTSSPAPSLPSTPSREIPPSSPSLQSTSDLSESASSVSSSQTIVPSSPTSASRQSMFASHDDGSTPNVPTNTPVISISGAAHAIAQMDNQDHNQDGEETAKRPIKTKQRSPPIDITQPHMSSPKTSYSVDPSSVATEARAVPKDTLAQAPAIRKSMGRGDDQELDSQLPQGPDGSIVGKAAGIMSSARAYLGLWGNGDRERSEG